MRLLRGDHPEHKHDDERHDQAGSGEHDPTGTAVPTVNPLARVPPFFGGTLSLRRGCALVNQRHGCSLVDISLIETGDSFNTASISHHPDGPTARLPREDQDQDDRDHGREEQRADAAESVREEEEHLVTSLPGLSVAA
ncbi:MAG: hypothetical protein WCC65_19475 [Pseudonocardiaceae bacterium]